MSGPGVTGGWELGEPGEAGEEERWAGREGGEEEQILPEMTSYVQAEEDKEGGHPEAKAPGSGGGGSLSTGDGRPGGQEEASPRPFGPLTAAYTVNTSTSSQRWSFLPS